jgi:photosystem II stability/assembly factor-like uncharacterized protein
LARPLITLVAAIALLGAGSTTAPAQESRIAPLADRSLLLDGVFVEGVAVVVGERGHVLISEDRGESWEQIVVPTAATLTGVHFHDRQLGWIVGHDATILRTEDGGRTWERVYHDPELESPLFDVWFRDTDNGFAIGAYGLFLVTSDGGTTWTRGAVGGEYDDFHLHHMARSESGRLYIAAEAGMIYRSDDEGQTWTELPSPYIGSFFGTLPLEGDVVLLFGLRGHLYRSEDAGETWTEIETGTVALLNRGLVTADGTVVVVGHEGAVLVSDDEGRSFTLRPQPDREAEATVIEADDGGLILVGEFGVSRMDAAIE